MTTEQRPWGFFTILSDEQSDHKVKRLVVNPGQRLSSQYHLQRDEHWFIVSGDAKATIDGRVWHIGAGASIDIKREQRHRVENTGNKPLVIIEVQTGDYFGEDDIVRVSDDYDRVQ